jgi:hypothetical protein
MVVRFLVINLSIPAQSSPNLLAGNPRRANSATTARERKPLKKTVSVRRTKVPKMSEQESVKETVSKATGVHFEVVAPHPAFPLGVDKLEWFMRCRNRDEIAKAPYLNTVWKEKGVGIWLESLAVGDTIDWIELAYGEERAGQSLDIDYSRFDDPSFLAEFNQKFPIVLGRIREYENVVAGISKKRKARLEIRRAGSKGMLVFTVAARVELAKGAAQAALGFAIKKNVSALKDAYEEIEALTTFSVRLSDNP